MVVPPAFRVKYRKLFQRSAAGMCSEPPRTSNGRRKEMYSETKRSVSMSAASTMSSSQLPPARSAHSGPMSPRSHLARHPAGSSSGTTMVSTCPCRGNKSARTPAPLPSSMAWPPAQRTIRATSFALRPATSRCSGSARAASRARSTPAERCTTAECKGACSSGKLGAFGFARASRRASASDVRPWSAHWCSAAFRLCRLCW
mmetsp:Transcript_126394/g.404672  ORF Transcript_126394/g.404672 Transcript_126394/m.404672 type:complete len:202 (+) Transcript_126394:391-996(+)